jgi:hypothetical protein
VTAREEAVALCAAIAEWVEGDIGGMADDEYEAIVLPGLRHLAADLGVEVQ